MKYKLAISSMALAAFITTSWASQETTNTSFLASFNTEPSITFDKPNYDASSCPGPSKTSPFMKKP